MKILLLLVSILFVNSVVAEPKKLVCSYTDLKGLETVVDYLFPGDGYVSTITLPIGAQIGSAEDSCKKYRNDTGGNYCEKAEQLRLFRDSGTCKNLGYLSRNVFTIDTSDLNTTNESNAELYSDNCGIPWSGGDNYAGVSSSDLKKVTMTATPSIIRFSGAWSTELMFNVDRKTLKSGYGTDRSWQCKLEDVDTSENLI